PIAHDKAISERGERKRGQASGLTPGRTKQRTAHRAIMPQQLADGETLSLEYRGCADRTRRRHADAEPGRCRCIGDGSGDKAKFYAARAGPFAHLYDGPQAFKQGAVAAECRGPSGAQRLDGGGAAEVEADFGFGGAGP